MTEEPGDQIRLTPDLLPHRGLLRLGQRVRRVVNQNGWPFDQYTTEEYLEGELGDAQLHDFVVERLPVIQEAYVGEEEGGSATYDVVAVVLGKGDAHWHSSQLSGNDVEAFAGSVEGGEDSPGLVHAVDSGSPCEIEVLAQFVVRGCTWAELEIGRLALTRDEIERRSYRHDQAEIRNLQALGLLPLYDELDEQ